MRYIVTAVAVAAALILICASALMNFTFWSEQGRSELEGHIFGGVSVAVDVFKSVLPVLIAFAVTARRWAYVALGSTGFVLFLASAVLAAIGFTAMNPGQVTGGREALSARYTLAERELSELDARVSGITGYPPIGTVEDNLHAMQQDARWLSSRNCADATLSKSREFCATYFAESAKLATAIEVSRLNNRRDELRREVSRLRDAGAGENVDPQASLVARLLPGFDVSGVQLALVVFFAVLVEFGAALGLFLATRHSAVPQRAIKGEPVVLEPAPVPRGRSTRRALGHLMQPRQPKPLRFVLDDAGRAFMEGR